MVQQFISKIAWDQVGQNAVNSLTNNAIGKVMGLFSSNSNNARQAAELQYKHNLKLQEQAQQWNEYMYKNRYSMQVDDLKNAGINPLFGMGQAPSVTSGTNSIGMADMVGEQNNKFNQMLGLLDFGQNLSAKRAQTKLLERQAQTEEQNTLLRTAEVLEKQINNKYLPEQRKAELKNLQTDTLEKLARINESKAQTKLINTTQHAGARELSLQKQFDKKHPIAKQWATALRRFGFGGSLGVSLPLKK